MEHPQVLSEDDVSPLAALVRQFSAPAATECPIEYCEHGPYLVIVYHRGRGEARGEKSPYSQEMKVVESSSGADAMHVTLDPAVRTPASNRSRRRWSIPNSISVSPTDPGATIAHA